MRAEGGRKGRAVVPGRGVPDAPHGGEGHGPMLSTIP